MKTLHWNTLFNRYELYFKYCQLVFSNLSIKYIETNRVKHTKNIKYLLRGGLTGRGRGHISGMRSWVTGFDNSWRFVAESLPIWFGTSPVALQYRWISFTVRLLREDCTTQHTFPRQTVALKYEIKMNQIVLQLGNVKPFYLIHKLARLQLQSKNINLFNIASHTTDNKIYYKHK